MIRFFILRIVLPLLLFYLLRSVLKGIFGGTAAPPRRPQPQVPAGGELKKDPVCGTYVSTATGITTKAHGEVVYFCSEECRKKYG
jgi:YHS domain-containing protein